MREANLACQCRYGHLRDILTYIYRVVGTGNAKAHQVLFLLPSTLPPPPFPYFLEQNLFFLREVGVDVFEANRKNTTKYYAYCTS